MTSDSSVEFRAGLPCEVLF